MANKEFNVKNGLSVSDISVISSSRAATLTAATIAGDLTVDSSTLKVDSSNNKVGLGTSSPNERLEVAGNLTLTPSSPNNSPSSGATISDINFVGRTDNAIVGKIRGIHNDNNNGTDGQLLFYTADNTASAVASEKMRINSTGNVGIGTTSPDCLLHVESSDHTVARLKAGTDKQASLRLQNDAQQWGVQCQTSDHFQIENLTSSNIPFQMNPDGYLILNRNASEYGVQLRSAGTRSGLVIDKPGTSTIMGSLLVLADESYRLGTASYYHVEMKQNGDTKINQNLLLTDSFGLRAYSGYFSGGTSTGTFIFNTYGAGCYEITAAFGHYGYINSYGCFRKAICSNGQGYAASNSIAVTDIATEIISTNGGSWSFSGYNSSTVPSGSNTTGTVRVVKNAGTYGGGGYYFVEVRGNQSS